MPAPVGAVTATAPLNGAAQAVLAVGLPIVIVGAAEVLATVALAVFVQPFAPVTVTLNAPTCKPLRFWVVALLLHIKLVPLLVSVTAPLNGVAQLVLFVGLALAVGRVGVLLIVALAVFVQPFAPVTVTV